MGAKKLDNDNVVPLRTRSRARTPEARENELVRKAYDLAEKQIDSGDASSQVITHFLKLGSTRERKEQKHLEMQTDLLKIRGEAIAAEARTEELFEKAIEAMRSYGPEGSAPPRNDDDSNLY